MIEITSLRKWAVLLMLSALPNLLQAAEAGRVLVTSDLKEQPYLDAKTIANLPVGTFLEVLQRQGGWMRVKSATDEGWLKMTAIKLGAVDTSVAKTGDNLSTLVNLATTGRSGSSGVTVTTGVRGLGQEELRDAEPDPEAVKHLDRFTSAKSEAAAFAAKANLQSRTLDYLDAASSSASNNGLFKRN